MRLKKKVHSGRMEAVQTNSSLFECYMKRLLREIRNDNGVC